MQLAQKIKNMTRITSLEKKVIDRNFFALRPQTGRPVADVNLPA